MAVKTVSEGIVTGPAETPVNALTAPDSTPRATGTGPAPDGPTGAVWAALAGNPGGTVTVIAEAAAVAKTAARKALLALESGGHAARTAGGHEGGKRAPDTWHPAPRAAGTGGTGGTGETETGSTGNTGPAPDTARGDLPDTTTADQDFAPAETAADADTGDRPAPGTGASPEVEENLQAVEPETTAGDDEPATAADPAESSGADAPEQDHAKDHQEDHAEGMEAAAVTEARDALTGLGAAITCVLQALDAGDRTGALAAAETIYTGSGAARRLVRAAATGRPRSASGHPKSHPGELRAKVAAHLAAYPGKEFTPHEIGKATGHSAGAVANALDRLIALDQAVQTCERPRRFTTASTTDTGTDETGTEAGTDGAATADEPQPATP